MAKQLTQAAYDEAFDKIAKAVLELVVPHLGETPDVWGNTACQAAENILDEVCKSNDIALPEGM